MDEKNQDKLRERYPKDFPIPPDRIHQGKLDLILEQELVEWKIVQSLLPEDTFITREELYREYIFSNFDQVLEFMSKVSEICNVLPHHPRWENTWTTLKVYLTTWDSTHIITYKDIMLARHMEEIYTQYGFSGFNAHQSIRLENERRKFYRKLKDEIRKGNLEEAFNKLSQTFTGPDEIEERNKISGVLSDFQEFIHHTRLKELSINQIRKKSKFFEDELSSIIASFDYSPKVFFSYAWGSEREKIIDELYETLKNDDDFEVVRDKVDLKYKGLISEFMKDIGKGNFVIIALSDKYLKSKYCMHELYELYRNSSLENTQLLNKIFPIKVENINLSDPKVRKIYLKHWRDQEKEWKELVSEFQDDQKNYKIIKNIRNSLPELLTFLSDINTQTIEIISKDDFKEIKDSINLKIDELNMG